MHFFTLSCHLPSGLPFPPTFFNFIHIQFLWSLFTIHHINVAILSHHVFSPNVLVSNLQCLHRCSYHISHTSFHCYHPSACQSMCSSRITYFHSTHSWKYNLLYLQILQVRCEKGVFPKATKCVKQQHRNTRNYANETQKMRVGIQDKGVCKGKPSEGLPAAATPYRKWSIK